VHHPLRECVGRPYGARTPAGEITGELPREIVPQRSEEGRLTALFPEYDELTISLPEDVSVTFRFAGDLFEMQDHRNWTDANFKSYGTPMSVPWPFDASPGDTIRQKVTISSSAPAVPPAVGDDVVVIELDSGSASPFPAFGLTAAGHGRPPGERQAALLRALRPDHLRVDLVLSDAGYPERLERGRAEAGAIGASLELAVFAGDEAESRLDELARYLGTAGAHVARLVVFAGGTGFSSTSGSTPAELVALARARLEGASGGAPVFGGTNQFFAELNRDRPDVGPLDGVAYSINPQVHAADDMSIVENLEAQAETVRTARTFVGELPIAITPITFVGRGGPFPAGPPAEDGLPGQVDVRQASLLGAAWTVGSVKHLAEAGVASTTWFETTGWLGVVETEDGPRRPDLFPSRPNDAFPLYHVLADVGEWKSGTLVRARSSHPLYVDALVARDERGTHVLVANMTPVPRRVRLMGVADEGAVRVRTLDDRSASEAMEQPEAFRARWDGLQVAGGAIELELGPFAVSRLDALS
jgi:hypothetical protein